MGPNSYHRLLEPGQNLPKHLLEFANTSTQQTNLGVLQPRNNIGSWATHTIQRKNKSTGKLKSLHRETQRKPCTWVEPKQPSSPSTHPFSLATFFLPPTEHRKHTHPVQLSQDGPSETHADHKSTGDESRNEARTTAPWLSHRRNSARHAA